MISLFLRVDSVFVTSLVDPHDDNLQKKRSVRKYSLKLFVIHELMNLPLHFAPVQSPGQRQEGSPESFTKQVPPLVQKLSGQIVPTAIEEKI